MTDVKVSVPPT